MLPTKEVENNYGYTGSYKEMNCLTAYGEYKSKLKETEASEDKPDAVKCAYDKYKYKSNDDEQDRMRKSAHKGIIADFCENSTTACNIEDESGNPVEPDEMCMDINVCDQGMTLFEIVPLALEFFKIFQVLLKDISPDEAAKLLASKKSRVNEFKKKQAQLKLIEMEAIKKKYNDVLKAERTKFIELYPNTKNLISATQASEENGEGQTNNSGESPGEGLSKPGGEEENENQPNPNQPQPGTQGASTEGTEAKPNEQGNSPAETSKDPNSTTAATAANAINKNRSDMKGGNNTTAGANGAAGAANTTTGVANTTAGTNEPVVPANTTAGTNGPVVPATETETTSNTEGNIETPATQESGSGNNNIKKNAIMDADWKKYNFEEALKSFKEYQLFKKICGNSDIIKNTIKEYEAKMTKNLTTEERETYKETNQLLNILEEYEKQDAQAKELQTTGAFSMLTKGVKNLSNKALEEDAVRKKCSNLALVGDVGDMVEGAFNAVTSPITKVAEIAKKGENNTKAAETPTPPAEGNQQAADEAKGANEDKSGKQTQTNTTEPTSGGALIKKTQKNRNKNKFNSVKFSRKKRKLIN